MPRQATMWRARVAMALDEMDRVAKRYGVHLGGCGCCGSPFCYVTDDRDLECVVENLELGDRWIWVNGDLVLKSGGVTL